MKKKSSVTGPDWVQSLRDRLSLSVLEDGSRKAERLENFLDTSNSTVQKFLYWEFLANILPSSFLLPMPTVTTYRATTVVQLRRKYQLITIVNHLSRHLLLLKQRSASWQMIFRSSIKTLIIKKKSGKKSSVKKKTKPEMANAVNAVIAQLGSNESMITPRFANGRTLMG